MSLRPVFRLVRQRLPRFLGPDPERMASRSEGKALLRLAAEGSADDAARAARWLGVVSPEKTAETLSTLLERPEASVRRAALRAAVDAGRTEVRWARAALESGARVLASDRRKEVQVVAAALLHLAGEDEARRWMLGLEHEVLPTFFGANRVGPLMEMDAPGIALRIAQILRPGKGLAEWRESAEAWRERGVPLVPSAPAEEKRALEILRGRVDQGRQNREDWEATVDLALCARGDDHPRLVHRFRNSPGPGLVQAVKALGLHGDPRAIPLLGDRIIDHDADPELGFALRRHGATALGRIGSPTAVGHLLPALRIEEDFFEGRPGAGCGVIFPVRANILWALGEIGDPVAAAEVAEHLADESGPSSGGFYLYAMDALLKMGPGAVAGIHRAVAKGPPRTGEPERARERMEAHAREVLLLLGEKDPLPGRGRGRTDGLKPHPEERR